MLCYMPLGSSFLKFKNYVFFSVYMLLSRRIVSMYTNLVVF